MKCKVFLLNSLFVIVMLFSFTLNSSAKTVIDEDYYSSYDIELSQEVTDVLESLGFEEFSAEEFSKIVNYNK